MGWAGNLRSAIRCSQKVSAVAIDRLLKHVRQLAFPSLKFARPGRITDVIDEVRGNDELRT